MEDGQGPLKADRRCMACASGSLLPLKDSACWLDSTTPSPAAHHCTPQPGFQATETRLSWPHSSPQIFHATSSRLSLPSSSTQESLSLTSALPGSPLGFLVPGTFTDLFLTPLFHCVLHNLKLGKLVHRGEVTAHNHRADRGVISGSADHEAHSSHCIPKAKQAGRELGDHGCLP